MFKKLFITLFVLVATKLSGFAQSSTLGSLNLWGDSCMAGAINNYVQASVSASNPSSSLSVEFHWGDGSSSTATSAQGYFYKEHNYVSAGTYTVAAVLFNGAVPIDTVTSTVEAFCTVVMGRGYKRADANCSYDPITEDIISAPFSIEVRKAGIPVDTIVSNGYLYKKINGADFTSVFSLHLLNAPAGMLAACPSTPYTFKFDTLNYNNFNGFEFAFDCDPAATGFDLFVTGSGFFRPVSNSYISLYPRNAACLPQNGTVTLNLSPKYSFASASPAPTSVSGNTITWDVAALSNTNFSSIGVTLNAVGTLTLGDTVQNHVSITPTSGDNNPANNNILMIDSIRSSFDPNEKHSSPIGDITSGQLMTYTIHFENMGNDTAFNIHIMDTLSTYLDASTLNVITSSHPVSHQLINNAGNKTIRFDFKDILLADASAPEANKGFVTYQINTKAGLALGTVIENTAHIYFDINPAIVTNTTRNKVPNNVGIRLTQNTHSIKVYPNPANDKLFVEGLADFKDLSIVNTIGQVFKIEATQSNFISIDQLPTGVYFLKATGKDGLYTQKFIKE